MRLTYVLPALVPAVYLATIYGGLPEQVPIRYDLQGEIIAYGPKLVLCLFPLISMVLGFGLDRAARRVKSSEKARFLHLFSVVFIAGLMTYLIYEAARGGPAVPTVLQLALGVFFIVTGNYLPTLPRNPWIGIRVPATLNDERVWRETHRFGGPVFLAAGLLTVLAVFVLPPSFALGTMIVIILLATIVTIGFAYTRPTR